MVDFEVEPFLKTERRNTDDSLVAERVKTNQSLEKSRHHTERETDETIISERIQIDHQLNSTRINADTALNLERNGAAFDTRNERAMGDQRLREERLRSDQAVERERARADVATVHERVVKSETAERLLAQERLLTDKSLQVERTNTDSKVHETSHCLAKEIAEHLQTKVSLTTRDEFLAIVSHDLRNPIGAAASSLEMLLEDSASVSLDGDTKHWIEFAKRNVDTSLRLISNLLDIERIAQGKLRLESGPNNLESIISEALECFVNAPTAKGIKLRSVFSVGSAVVDCDRDRILQVLSNLVSNALKFTPDGGSITVTTKCSHAEVTVAVSDSGSGIAPEKFKQIFDRFTQLNSRDRRGLGLGLHISKMFVEAHDGKIWVESKVGAGSTFHFTLPKKRRG